MLARKLCTPTLSFKPPPTSHYHPHHVLHFHHCPPPTPHHRMTAKATEEPRVARGAPASTQGCVTLLDDQQCTPERWMGKQRPPRLLHHHTRLTNCLPSPSLPPLSTTAHSTSLDDHEGHRRAMSGEGSPSEHTGMPRHFAG